MRRRRVLLPLFLAWMTAGATPPDPKPGTYLLDHANGTLHIQRREGNVLGFDLQSIGANCHTCDVSGTIRNGVGVARSGDGDTAPQCRVAFSGTGTALAVRPLSDACRDFCGARATFDGTYSVPPAACTDGARQAQRDKALGLYRARRYADSVAMLRTLSAQCGNFIGWMEMDRIRNDLALAHYHNGEPARCLETLDQTIAGSARDEEDLKNGGGNVSLGPCEFDSYRDLARSTWFNKGLCSKALPAGR